MSAVRQFKSSSHGDAPQNQARSLRIALTGNPNCGKTTIFNGYTGARQHVGNYPGVTVDKKEGYLTCGGKAVTLVDLPGTYSLTAYSQEELVARHELSADNVQAIIGIVESSALERGLLLVVQMLEMGLPVVLGCNMMDEARKAGIHIDTERLESLLGYPVVTMVGRTGEGLDKALSAAVELAESARREPLRLSYGQDMDEALAKMEQIIARSGLLARRYHPRWVALKLLEGDAEVQREARAADSAATAELEAVCQKTAAHLRDTLNTDIEAVVIGHRYGYIRSLLRDGVLRRDPGKDRLAVTDKLDRVLTNAFFGPLLMLVALFLVFQITFTLGDYPKGWVEDGFSWLSDFCGENIPDGLAKSLLTDGIIAGVGGVVSFVPLIIIMFSLISFMEDSGYLARVAYMMDRIFHIFGLHGASVMPYVISGGIAGGCAIPGVMATRTLRSPKEKLATLLTLPYMTCGAKLPLMMMLTGAFFPESAAFVMFLVTVTGWLAALFVARLLRSTLVRGEPTPFVMELPPYRMPTLFSVLLHCWERAWMYLKKAGTVLLAISILIWAAMTFPSLPEEEAAPYEQKIEQIQRGLDALPEDSAERAALEDDLKQVRNDLSEAELSWAIAGRLGKAIEPVTLPAGFDWRTDIALLAGIAAKEAVVATMATAYSLGEMDAEESEPLAERLKADKAWSKATALALMLFVLLYSPCFVALVVIRQEAGSWGWVAFSMVFNTILAYAVATCAYQGGRVFWG
ncbi:MAG: ferrous iron transport protein B [Desulfovibrio sp.]|nr:ferrous iron transport protein B [Desulfovibrio sp.]